MDTDMTPLTRITHDLEVMGGKPCIRGMRITVGTIVGLVGGQLLRECWRRTRYLKANRESALLRRLAHQRKPKSRSRSDQARRRRQPVTNVG